MTLLLVAIGGAVGSVLRWLVVTGAQQALGPSFPFGTLAVNVAGSFAMGLAAALLLATGGTPGPAAVLVMTGLLGGFTTFSAFSLDAVGLWERGAAGPALAYVAASVILSVLALAAGLALGRSLA